jgi:uncharacterized ferritin-like protein (DUF455 family)
MNSVVSAHFASTAVACQTAQASENWRLAALAALCERDPVAKAEAVRNLQACVADGAAHGVQYWDPQWQIEAPADLPGRPARPELVEPRLLQRRSMSTPQGRAVLLHALAHIEFNAINLALDAVWRFAGMPEAFYSDWLTVAAEEAYHFSLLRERLALVPRVLEARGLDAAPPIRARLKQAGDDESAAILDVILRDEVGHVQIGNHWFRCLCDGRGLDAHAAWLALAQQYNAPKMRGPFNLEARRKAGFDETELAALAAQDAAEQAAANARRHAGVGEQ